MGMSHANDFDVPVLQAFPQGECATFWSEGRIPFAIREE